MNRLPNIEITDSSDLEIKDLAEDLKIINEDVPKIEDLKSDPFVRAKPLIQQPIQPETKPKRRVSDKQKQHLANARKLAKEKKQQALKEKQEAKLVKKEEPIKQEPIKQEPIKEEPIKQVPVNNNEEKEFEKWCNYMDKYGDMMEAYTREQQKKELEKKIKQQEEEQRYYKKFMALQEEKKRNKNVDKKQENTNNIDSSVDILNNNAENDFGQYSNYF